MMAQTKTSSAVNAAKVVTSLMQPLGVQIVVEQRDEPRDQAAHDAREQAGEQPGHR